MGRKPIYTNKFDKVAYKLARRGLFNKEIYETLCISEPTGCDWRKKYSSFNEAIIKGHQEAKDILVEKSLFELATGFTMKAEKILVVSNGLNMGSEVVRVKTKQYFPPNVSAQKYWLSNRKHDKWQDRQSIEHSGKLEYKVIPDDIDDENSKED